MGVMYSKPWETENDGCENILDNEEGDGLDMAA